MTTATALTSLAPGTSMPSNSSSGSSAYSLSPESFIKLMVTQLQSQDPLKPADNSELLSQMSNIGQLESSTDLQSTMKSVTLQSQVGSGSALIGKQVTGIDGANKSVTGVVQSVSVSGSDVTLNLDNGDSVAMSNVSSISAATSAAGGTATPAPTTTTPTTAPTATPAPTIAG